MFEHCNEFAEITWYIRVNFIKMLHEISSFPPKTFHEIHPQSLVKPQMLITCPQSLGCIPFPQSHDNDEANVITHNFNELARKLPAIYRCHTNQPSQRYLKANLDFVSFVGKQACFFFCCPRIQSTLCRCGERFYTPHAAAAAAGCNEISPWKINYLHINHLWRSHIVGSFWFFFIYSVFFLHTF